MEFDDEECNAYAKEYPLGSHAEKKSKHSPKSTRVHKRAMTTDKRCSSCSTSSTPVWRWGGEAKDRLLCNACSLRIRRSVVKPGGRAKSPGERALKKAAHSSAATTTASDSAAPSAEDRDTLSGDLPHEDESLFRERLHGLVIQERDRLMGSWSTLSPEENWGSSPWATMSPLSASNAGHNISPTTPRPAEWEAFRVFSGLSDTSRLDFHCPSSPYGLGDPGIY